MKADKKIDLKDVAFWILMLLAIIILMVSFLEEVKI